jgi:hypothetical protein
MRNLKCIIIIAVVVLLWGRPCVGKEIVSEKETLRGIKDMSVVIENLNPDIKRHGITVEKIRRDVELKLRMAGINVLSLKKEWSNTKKTVALAPQFYVRVSTFHVPPSYGYALSIEISLKRWFEFEENKISRVTTWHDGAIGFIGETVVASNIRNFVKDQVDGFLTDYLAVNPIKPGTSQKKT